MDEQKGSGVNILFVDDDENVLRVFKRDFGREYAVITATSGFQALEILKKNRAFQIIITDYKMPQMNGIEFLKSAQKVSPHSIKIILTGYADLQICIDAVNKGNIFRFFTKPVEHVKLLKGIKEAVVQYRLNALTKSDELKNDFLTIISHEIRTPLNSITNFLQLIKDEIGISVFKKVENEFGIIDKNAKRLIRTIELMVNISEVISNTIEIKKRNLNLIKDAIIPVLQEYSTAAEEKGLEIDFSSSEDEYEIIIDQYCLDQILKNIIDNAIKFSEKGKIIITVKKIDGSISISISDNGIGMSEEFQQIMYEPFVQEQRGYSRKYEGNGLGLTLVKEYCLLNDIEIDITSKVSKGTTFSLKFG